MIKNLLRLKQYYLLVIFALLAAFPALARDFIDGEIIYTVLSEEEKTCEAKGYHDTQSLKHSLIIPSTVSDGTDTFTVTTIGEYAFYNSNFETLKLPDSILYIGKNSFGGNQNLQEIEIPESVQSIGDSAFGGCLALQNISIPAEYRTFIWIGDGAFSGTAIQSLSLPSCPTHLGKKVFFSCKSLTEVEIPKSVELIGSNPFPDCYALTNIRVSEENSSFASLDGVLYNKDFTKLISILRLFFENLLTAPRSQVFNPLKI